jgi:hypothetical protein
MKDQQDQIKTIEKWGFRVIEQTTGKGKRLLVVGSEYSEDQYNQLESWGWDVDRECERIIRYI